MYDLSREVSGIPPEKSAEAIVAVPLEGQGEGLNNLLRQTLKMYVSEERLTSGNV